MIHSGAARQPRAGAGLKLIVWKEGSARGGREDVFPHLISVSQAWLRGVPAPSWREMCSACKGTSTFRSPPWQCPGAQGLVAWHLDELVAASSHRCPDPRALSPAWPDLLACPCPPVTRRGGGDDLPSPHTCVGKRLWSPQAALRGSLLVSVIQIKSKGSPASFPPGGRWVTPSTSGTTVSAWSCSEPT